MRVRGRDLARRFDPSGRQKTQVNVRQEKGRICSIELLLVTDSLLSMGSPSNTMSLHTNPAWYSEHGHTKKQA